MIEIDLFIWRAILAGIGVSAVAGTMGSLLIWKKMAFFSDSLSHSALLGIALGLALSLHVNTSILVTGAVFSFLLLILQEKRILATDTLLSILAHSALAIGVVSLHFSGKNVDLHSFLFGDILLVSDANLWWIYGGSFLALGLLSHRWSALVLMTLSEDLARAEHHSVFKVHLTMLLAMAIVVAISVRVVGILLITSLLIIPAATIRFWVRSPEAMAVGASLLCALSVILGVFLSLHLDAPTGPMIVVVASMLFTLGVLARRFIKP